MSPSNLTNSYTITESENVKGGEENWEDGVENEMEVDDVEAGRGNTEADVLSDNGKQGDVNGDKVDMEAVDSTKRKHTCH